MMAVPSYTRSASVYDLLYVGAGIKNYREEAAELDRIVRKHNPGARSLLDVACGTGQHLAYLRETYDVEGVDVTPDMLAVAAGRLPGVPLQQGDMRDLDLGRRFDAVVCMFSSIGHLTEPEEMREAFARFARHLNPGGVLVVDGWVRPEAWRPGYLPPLQQATDGKREVYRLVYSRREGPITTLTHHYLVRDASGIDHFVEEHVLALTPTSEYVHAAEAAGLHVEVKPNYMPDRDRIIGVRAH
jgi:dTDP-3-amino-3,6-dideoxy-alpha-D-glucopyranose N,N-dimethyltransferase/dTDP-3-amino-3,4,6-trideoxy-alpha-D-glucopyranose N,N-dimethyltransferase/N-methyltransferase